MNAHISFFQILARNRLTRSAHHTSTHTPTPTHNKLTHTTFTRIAHTHTHTGTRLSKFAVASSLPLNLFPVVHPSSAMTIIMSLTTILIIFAVCCTQIALSAPCSGSATVNQSLTIIDEGVPGPTVAANMNCQWHITPPPGKVVALQFLKMDLTSTNTDHDSARLFYNGVEIAHFVGIYRPEDWVAPGSQEVVVSYQSSSNPVRSGLTIRVLFLTNCPNGQEDDQQGSCVDCAAGMYRDASKMTACAQCTTGFSNSSGSASCSLCPSANVNGASVRTHGTTAASHNSAADCMFTKRFFYLSGTFTVSEADAACRAVGATLATILTLAEHTAAQAALSFNASTPAMWMGVVMTNGIVSWISGESFFENFTNFEYVSLGASTNSSFVIQGHDLSWIAADSTSQHPALCSRYECSDSNSYIRPRSGSEEDGDFTCAAQPLCTPLQYESSPASFNQSRICQGIQICDNATQYEAAAPTATSNRQCFGE